MSRIRACGIVFILAFWFSLSLSFVTSAQVVLTDEEARSLGHELMIAKTSIVNCRTEIKNSSRKLLTANERLKMLSGDLEVQKKNLIEQKMLLDDANKSLRKLNEEHKKQIHRLSRQRNFAYLTAGTLILVPTFKKLKKLF